MNVYLASKSKARKKLLTEIFGLKVKVISSGIKEEDKARGLSYAELVKKNALNKAREAAKKVKAGIIIGADTITIQGNKIYGKPKDMKEAKRMLKRLSSGPQLVYTGLAVISKSKDRFRVELDYEKTKVYMDKLNDKEINDYFRSVSPLDKAGSFDIQGKGAFFMRSIEGCFYNVVGLPLRKLYRILKKMGVSVLKASLVSLCIFVFMSLLSGCTTEYNLVTKEEEIYFYSTDREVALGRAVVRQVEKEYKVMDNPVYQRRVENIGRKIVAVCDRKDVDYYFGVLDDDEVNAFSLPGGFIYINKGLIDKVANDDELAGVVAHEVAHIVARHSIKKLQAMQGYNILSILIAGGTRSQSAVAAADEAFTQVMLGYAREDELLADQLATRYLRAAGYNPEAMVKFLEKLDEVNKRRPLRPKTYYKTHPYVPDRVRIVREELGERMTFTDYINIQDKKHE